MAAIYVPSAAVSAALGAYEDKKKSKPMEYRSAWEAQIQSAMDAILNREPFHYHLNGDALYRQYRQEAMRNGRLAMMDTMGQASALTGGYGNSYAQSVGQQAYNAQLATLNDRIPELYAMALEQYRLGGEDLKARYGLLSDRESQDYSRYQDALADWQKDADRLYSIYGKERDFDYGAYRDRVADSQWQTEFDEAKRRYDAQQAAAQAAQSAPKASTVVYRITNNNTGDDKKKKTDTGIKGILI